MKKILFLMFALMIGVNSMGQYDFEQQYVWNDKTNKEELKMKYTLFQKTKYNSQEYKDYWKNKQGDSLVFAIVNNDTINAIKYNIGDTIYTVIDEYYTQNNNINHIIFTKEIINNLIYRNGENGILYVLIDSNKEYFTSQPNTKISDFLEYKTKDNNIIREYKFVTDSTYKLSKKEIDFFYNKNDAYKKMIEKEYF